MFLRILHYLTRILHLILLHTQNKCASPFITLRLYDDLNNPFKAYEEYIELTIKKIDVVTL